IHRTEDSQGIPKLKEDARAGGKIAGNARKQLEKKLGKSVVSQKRFIEKTENDLTLPEIEK
ncbi:MAG: phage antirepressor protein, partial [Proteobacteria bacterium]|nr:phage antirepressor protein [Pseudomonadota bacterium]